MDEIIAVKHNTEIVATMAKVDEIIAVKKEDSLNIVPPRGDSIVGTP